MIRTQQNGIKYSILVVFLIFASGTYSQNSYYTFILDSLSDIDQYYSYALASGSMDTSIIDSIRGLDTKSFFAHNEKVKKNEYGMDSLSRNSLLQFILGLNNRHFVIAKKMIKLHGYPLKKLDARKIHAILVHNSQEIKEDDSLYGLLKIELLHKRIKPVDYAKTIDLIAVKQKRQEVFNVLYKFNKVTKNACLTNPIDLEFTNLQRKKIGLKKWKMKCLK